MYYELTKPQMREMLGRVKTEMPFLEIWVAAGTVAQGLGADPEGVNLTRQQAAAVYTRAHSGPPYAPEAMAWSGGKGEESYSEAEVSGVVEVLMALQADLVAGGLLHRPEPPDLPAYDHAGTGAGGGDEDEPVSHDCPCCVPSEREPAEAPSSPEVASSGLKDTGARTQTETGGMREPGGLRGRFDLLPPEALKRYAVHMARGAMKYADRNWEKGIETARCLESALRHLNDFMAGDTAEDHLAAAFWNIGALMTMQDRIGAGDLPESLETLPPAMGFDRPAPWKVG